MRVTRSYSEAKKLLCDVEVKLSQNCVRFILRDVSPIECATYCTDELEKFLVQYSDDMTMTHRELFTLMCQADRIESRLYDMLSVEKPTR